MQCDNDSALCYCSSPLPESATPFDQMLENHLGNSFMEKEEIDKKTVIRTNWKKLIKQVHQTECVHRRGFVSGYQPSARR